MSSWVIEPSQRPLRGSVVVPGDKSISHRAVLLNALASGPARVKNLLVSADVKATVNAVVAMGAGARVEGRDTVVVTPPPGGLREPEDVIDCRNSGTSMRLLAGVAAGSRFFTVLTGDASLRRRPMGRIARPLRRMGAVVDGRDGGERAPLCIRGGELQMVQWELDVASAQVKSACLLAGLRCGVAVREPRPSRDHTERMLAAMGVVLRRNAEDWLVALPSEGLEPLDVVVPGDISSAAFWLVAACVVPGSEIAMRGVGINPTRCGVIDALVQMGADIDVTPAPSAGAEPVADIVVRHRELVGTVIDGDLALRCLDELPVLCVAAAVASGETVVADAAELRVKESDRIATVASGLRSLGIQVQERPDGLTIAGGRLVGPGYVDATGDHRIAMAFAVAGLACPGGVTIEGADSVAASYPSFPAHLEALRG